MEVAMTIQQAMLALLQSGKAQTLVQAYAVATARDA